MKQPGLTIERTIQMDIIKAASRPTLKAPAKWFTGTVWQDTVVEAPAPARVRALRVTFEPGARTAWHTHPLGQTLHVLSGVCLVGLRGAPARRIQAGDTVWINPGEEHWHGATPDIGMVHLAIQEAENGATADWLEHVSDADYTRTAISEPD
jgi:quercetin dioxygenase-like cupin family protein